MLHAILPFGLDFKVMIEEQLFQEISVSGYKNW